MTRLAADGRQHPPVGSGPLLEAVLAYGLPAWMADSCLVWVRVREGRGWEFASASAAVRVWLGEGCPAE